MRLPRLLLGAVLLAAGCASPVSTPGEGSITPPSSAHGSVEPSDDPAQPPTQTETEWGVIWDALPSGFPKYPGAIPTETRAGPVTAQLAIPTDPASAATWYRHALETAGYRTEAVSEPLEDGSVVVDAAGPPEGCRVQLTLTPLSGTTVATILFAAACPFG